MKKIEGLDGDASPGQCEAEITGLEPQVVRLFQLVTTAEQRQHRATVGGRSKAPPKLRINRSADGRLVQVEQFVDVTV